MNRDADPVRFERSGRVGLITIHRPEVRNAINGAVARGIETAIDAIEDDQELWVGIITGSGPVFSSGADLKAARSGEGGRPNTVRGGFAGVVRRKREKPLIAAVDGPAIGGGCEIVLACDLVVASTAARFGLPEVKRGLIAGAGGIFRAARHMPLNIAMEMVLTGDPLDAAAAAKWGLVNVLTEPGEAKQGALCLAERITANAPMSVRYSRKAMLETRALGDEEAFQVSADILRVNCETEDYKEGPRAFLEKRPPAWKGR